MSRFEVQLLSLMCPDGGQDLSRASVCASVKSVGVDAESQIAPEGLFMLYCMIEARQPLATEDQLSGVSWGQEVQRARPQDAFGHKCACTHLCTAYVCSTESVS